MTETPTTPMDEASARLAVSESLRRIVPDADPGALPDDTRLRDALELDSLDMLSFVELLSARAGRRIDEEEYPQLETMASCVALLTREPPA
jgi:acyl carrier protein